MINGQDLELFWNELPQIPGIAPGVILHEAEREIELCKNSFTNRKHFKDMKFFDALAYLGNDFVFEDSKDLGRDYTINLYIPASARLFTSIMKAFLPYYIQTYSPGFPYNCTIAFDDENVMREYMAIKTDLEKIASYQSYVNKINYKLDPFPDRIKRGAYAPGAR